ncbi:D-sedoheptulose-7-phosphate isomerase [Cellulomonas fimi]|uniref:Sugar isomerase (SIS) n=1 Tax=Cellulomonas fimi (strain ATCC 484 / DSM 20113 / JCM 1341 / CCUG 24087 / LMG 16345 / NBRC 15513 / NCIMB 8980 / NCTC 7547 / NRS-133) TaxID=590998 RepID=F4H5Z1_CELFA|nr:SIS domain-containing protein [Cellulomonas fimi]AEE46721.1 sugar isomerase (SIS) [Cellulomonas fimi ATCC 484]NNH07634.1 SIS domain-containing protein [Cellulomonas fimi]VEH33985.1 Phosphoheptose isomerase 1 [Cellulomonas fimi]
MSARDWIGDHRRELTLGLSALQDEARTVERWGRVLAVRLAAGSRLLAAGNGGSAAEAQHLTGELVGRFLADRRPLSAIALCADSASYTAIVNDYGADEVFARQVDAHGRPGDVLVLLSTSGRSPNVVRAAERGRAAGLLVWGLTGPAPNPLAALCHASLCVPAPSTAAIQAVHLVAVHALCAALDAHLPAAVDAGVRLDAGPATPGHVTGTRDEPDRVAAARGARLVAGPAGVPAGRASGVPA